MKQFEYKTITITPTVVSEISALNEAGKDGWEVVGIFATAEQKHQQGVGYPPRITPAVMVFYMKRELPTSE